MPRTTMAATLLACLILTAGCGGSAPDVNADDAAATSSTPSIATTPATTAGSVPASELWKKIESNAARAKSVRLIMSGEDDGERVTCDMRLSSSGKASGTLTFQVGKVTLRRIGKTVYFKGDRRFWADIGNSESKAMSKDWFRTTENVPDTAILFHFTDMDYLLKRMLNMNVLEKNDFTRVPGITIEGQKTVGLTTKWADTDLVYATQTEPSLPVNITVAKDKSRYMKFREWNHSFTVVRPAPAYDVEGDT